MAVAVIKTRELTWDEFKNEVERQRCADIVYRGHTSKIWKLESTLFRFLKPRGKQTISLKRYYKILEEIWQQHPELTQSEGFKETSFPKQNFLGLFCPLDEKYQTDTLNFLKIMIALRHYGFPSPLLDWTKDPYIAAFFALTGTGGEDVVIFSLEQKNDVKAYSLQKRIIRTDISFPDLLRETVQKAKYTICMNFEGVGPQIDKENFSLGAYEDCANFDHMVIEKYLIRGLNRLSVLKELYEIHKISYQKIYIDPNIHENVLLKDLANKKLLLE